ncbi:MAG: hypothetical protein AB1411_03020 [Nitrospirota bacterium]
MANSGEESEEKALLQTLRSLTNDEKRFTRDGGGFFAELVEEGQPMELEEARARIEAAIGQYGQRAANAIELVINEVRSDLGAAAVNELIDEFDLELQYNIAPLESDYSNF